MGTWIRRGVVAIGVTVALAQLLWPDRWILQTWIAAGTPWIYLPALPLLAWTVRRRHWPESAGLALVVALWLIWLAPRVFGGGADGAPDLRVASINALAWNDHPDALARDIASIDAEVLTVQEVSPELADRLESEAFDRWPHRLVHPRADAFGIAVLSEFPLEARLESLGPSLAREAHEGGVVSEPMVVADVDIAGRSLRLLVVHTLPPFSRRYASVWRRQTEALVARVAEERRPLMITGDLNATPFHRLVRELRSHGLEDGHDAVGRGLATTFPTDRWLPPMLLDHVFASDELSFTDVEEKSIAGSDHRSVVASLRWN